MASSSRNLSEHSPYHDQQLEKGEIRLLKIVAIEPALEISTQKHEVTASLEFDAMSYVWGTAPATVGAKCNGKPFLLTPTAEEMLKHLYLYRPALQRPLWIDAICINQEDPDEKAIQIPFMRDIYSRAAQVIVWMGCSTPGTDAFMTEFHRLSKIARTWITTGIDHQAPGVRKAQGWPSYDHPMWTGCHRLMSREWFRRLWTFQEVILARKAIVFCGSFCIDLDELMEFVVNGHFGTSAYITGWHDAAWEESRTIQRYRDTSITEFEALEPIGIPQLLDILRYRRVKEQVDRIWAVTGLFEKHMQKNLAPKVDYSVEGRKEYHRTFVNFAKILIVQSGPLALLCVPPAIGPKNKLLPSWCPDFSGLPACLMLIIDLWNYPISDPSQPSHLVFYEEQDEEKRCYERLAAVQRHPKRDISTSEHDNLLRIRGFCVDTISEVVEDSRLLGTPEFREKTEWATYTTRNSSYVASMDWQSRSLALSRHVLSYSDEGESKIPPEYLMAFYANHRISKDAEAAYTDAISVLRSNNPGLQFNQLEFPRRARASECISRFKALSGHTFFSTRGGRIGIATPGCKPGDKVCTFYGGHPLHILRWPSCGDGDSNSPQGAVVEFMGVAFVPHLMEPHQADDVRLGEDEIFTIG